MSLSIRSSTPDDYSSLCAIASAIQPEYPETVEEWRHHDAHRDPKCRWQRWLAEREGTPVAYAEYGQSSFAFHPRKFWLSMHVHPEHQGCGIGGTLYRHLLQALEPLDPVVVRTDTREDRPRALRFLATAALRSACAPGSPGWTSRASTSHRMRESRSRYGSTGW